MANDFSYDVFLSHSTKDKPVVRAIAKRLRADGLRVWLDDWEIRPGDSIPAKIEEGLEHSRVLVLCMSANAFGSDWAQLESGTFRFRDPLNKERRFIPLRLDEAPIKGSLAQFLHINWHPQDNEEQAYAKLFEACRPPARPPTAKVLATRERFAEKAIKLNYSYPINAYAFSLGDKHILSGNNDRTVRLVGHGGGELSPRAQGPRGCGQLRGVERRWPLRTLRQYRPHPAVVGRGDREMPAREHGPHGLGQVRGIERRWPLSYLRQQ